MGRRKARWANARSWSGGLLARLVADQTELLTVGSISTFNSPNSRRLTKRNVSAGMNSLDRHRVQGNTRNVLRTTFAGAHLSALEFGPLAAFHHQGEFRSCDRRGSKPRTSVSVGSSVGLEGTDPGHQRRAARCIGHCGPCTRRHDPSAYSSPKPKRSTRYQPLSRNGGRRDPTVENQTAGPDDRFPVDHLRDPGIVDAG